MTVPKGIRGLDPELYNQARAEAVRRRMTIGQWINEAMAEKLMLATGMKVGKGSEHLTK